MNPVLSEAVFYFTEKKSLHLYHSSVGKALERNTTVTKTYSLILKDHKYLMRAFIKPTEVIENNVHTSYIKDPGEELQHERRVVYTVDYKPLLISCQHTASLEDLMLSA